MQYLDTFSITWYIFCKEVLDFKKSKSILIIHFARHCTNCIFSRSSTLFTCKIVFLVYVSFCSKPSQNLPCPCVFLTKLGCLCQYKRLGLWTLDLFMVNLRKYTPLVKSYQESKYCSRKHIRLIIVLSLFSSLFCPSHLPSLLSKQRFRFDTFHAEV